jgi:hypothetical protein
MDNNVAFDLSKPPIILSQDEKTETATINNGLINGIDIDVKLTRSSGIWSVSDITSHECGITFPWTWDQSSYNKSLIGNEITVDVIGYIHYNIFVNGIGTVYKSKRHYQLKINNITGKITSVQKI